MEGFGALSVSQMSAEMDPAELLSDFESMAQKKRSRQRDQKNLETVPCQGP